MGRLLNKDVIKLIQSIVVKNKIRSCCWEYHKTYCIICYDHSTERYAVKGDHYYSFNYRRSVTYMSQIYRLHKKYSPLSVVAELPKNYYL